MTRVPTTLAVDSSRMAAVIGTAKLIRKLTWPEAKEQGEREAKKAIRRAIAKPLRELRRHFLTEGYVANDYRMQAIREIDLATRAPRKAKR